MRRWKISTAMSSGTVTITPAAMMVPYGVSKPVVPVNLLMATVAVCFSGVLQERQREQELVPRADEHDDRRREHARCGQRKDDLPERDPGRAAVDHGRLLQLDRHLLEERGQVPHRQRQAETQPRDDDGLVGVDPVREPGERRPSRRTSSAAAGSG